MSPALAVDINVVRLLFNNDSTNLDSRCSSTEWSLIDSILTDSTKVTNADGEKRNLRSVMDDNNNSINNEVKSPIARELYPKRCKDDCAGSANGTCRKPGCVGYSVAPTSPTAPEDKRELYPKRCKVDCVGYAAGTCRKPGCEGYGIPHPPAPLERRELYPKRCNDACAGYTTGTCRQPGCAGYLVAPPTPTSEPLVRQRQLSNSNMMITTLCPKTQIQFIHEKLNDLIRHNNVSITCQAVLKQKRHVTCYHHGNDDKIDK
jgi:hypothetical protein